MRFHVTVEFDEQVLDRMMRELYDPPDDPVPGEPHPGAQLLEDLVVQALVDTKDEDELLLRFPSDGRGEVHAWVERDDPGLDVPGHNVTVRFEQEEIDVTRAGILPPYKADPMRRFVPGLTMVHVTVDGEQLPPMSIEEYKNWEALAKGTLP